MKSRMAIAGFCLFTLILSAHVGAVGSSEGFLVPAAVGEQIKYSPALD